MAVKFFLVSIYLVFIFLGPAYSLEEDLSNGSRNRVRRDVRPVEFDVDGEKYQFNFILSDHQVFSRNAPVWLAKSKPGNSPNYTYELVKDSAHMMDGHLYIDNDKAAVAYVHYDQNQKKIFYDGVFGESKNRHIIKSLPENHRPRARSGRKNSDHIVYKTTMRNVEFPTPIKKYSDLFTVKLEKPLDQFYPKLLIVVDNHLFKSLGSDVAKTIKYIATFWSAVNQKYLEIESPKVQIMVTGIIIADDEKALNYIYQSPSLAKEKNASLSWAMLEQLRLYFHNDFSKVMDFQNYDATFLMTGQNIFPVGGETFRGKICANWYNDAIVADDGDYSGLQPAAHELAHLLNSDHDPLEGGKCTARGPDHSVSMMSPVQIETDNLVWSKCTKEYIKEFATVKAAECLRDRHRQRHYDENLPE